tara:strand:- start:165 stop:296 length:132 start_codon:yes stop_codon:yes gene_type:complete
MVKGLKLNKSKILIYGIFPDDDDQYKDDGQNSRMIGTKNAYSV